jgi:pimeloyl-ACP methyl ester carboxylesterase
LPGPPQDDLPASRDRHTPGPAAAAGLTEPPDKNGDARDEYDADTARTGNPAPDHAAGLLAGMRCSTARRLTRGVLGRDTPGGPDPGIFDTLGALTAELAKITQPTLAASGHRDIMTPAINSYTLAQHIPDSQLITHPGSMLCRDSPVEYWALISLSFISASFGSGGGQEVTTGSSPYCNGRGVAQVGRLRRSATTSGWSCCG